MSIIQCCRHNLRSLYFGQDSRYYLTVDDEDDVSDVVDLRHYLTVA